jgi:hypothetical protein
MATFDSVWSRFQSGLKPGDTIKNWTVLKGYLGDTIKIVRVGSGFIDVDAPHAMTTQHISKGEFEKVWEVWPEYKGGKFPRHQFQEITRFSKYIISILHWVDQDRG